MSKEEFDLEKVLKAASEAWKETKEHFGLKDTKLIAKVKVLGWKDINIEVKDNE